MLNLDYHLQPLNANITDDFDIVKMPKYIVNQFILEIEEENQIQEFNDNCLYNN